MTKSFSAAFTHFLTPSEETIRVALTSGFVVLDTNVLLSAYRFAPKAREELLSTLHTLGNRVWVPHQVGLEFHRNRLEVMAERRATYDAVLNSIDSHKQTAQADLEGKIRNLSNQAALTEKERDRLLIQLEQVFSSLQKSVKRLSNDHAPADIESEDPILARLQAIIGNRVGDEFDEQSRADALTEAERRAKEKIPPGFKDAGKPNGGYGDYFVWRQTLEETKRRSVAHLVFVTGDRKEDWYLKVKGKIVAAQPELAEEVHRWCGAQLVLMSTQTLLFHATQYLNANVSSETIRQAGELPTTHSPQEERLELAIRQRELRVSLDYAAREMDSAHDETARLDVMFEDIDMALKQTESQSERDQLLLKKGALDVRRRMSKERLQEVAQHRAEIEHAYHETLWALRNLDRQRG
ncbi:PIN-like domain-containing protein [Micromonospora sp. NPDC047620]|uniref:PIN-like domain-containing protein n=1 Tax=Micromonospora sp. NPDC047620 TaxID=3364251 RepID=UPI003721D56B